MWIERVSAAAFGPLEDAELELRRGLNVLCGRNESGKSSWHAAIYAALCGMRRAKGSPRTEDREFAERYRPWHADRWEVAAVVQLADGRRLELRHDLDGTVESRIVDLGTGREVSADYMHDGAPDGATLLGLTRDLMPSTVFVRQADVLRVLERADALQSDLQRAAATGGGAATAEQAIRHIDDFRSENVGSEVRHSTKPLRTALNRVEESTIELADARNAYQSYLEMLRTAEDAREDAERAERRLLIGRAVEARAWLRRMEDRFERAHALERELSERGPTEMAASQEATERVRNALAAFRNLPPLPELPEGRSVPEIRTAIELLPNAPDGDVEIHESVARGRDEWTSKIAALEAIRLEGMEEVEEPTASEAAGFQPGELRRFASELEASLPELDPSLAGRIEQARVSAAASRFRRKVAAAFGLVLSLAGALALWAAQTGALALDWLPTSGVAGLLLGIVIVVAALRRSSSEGAQSMNRLESLLAVQIEARRQAEARQARAAERIRRLGLPETPDALHAHARHLENVERQMERRRLWQDRVARHEGAVRNAEAKLGAALIKRDPSLAGDWDDITALYARYEEGCRRRAAQTAQVARRDSLESELRARNALEHTVQRELEIRRQAEEVLREACGVADVSGEDPGKAIEDLGRWLNRQVVLQRVEQSVQEVRATLDGLLEGRTLVELRTELERLRSELPTLPKEAEGIDARDEPLDDLEGLDAVAREARGRADQLAGEVAERERSLASVVEAEERHERALQELERVRSLDRTLERTSVFLKRAKDGVQRLVAPRLQDSLTRWLPRITTGRYEEVLVDPESLMVRVRTATGEWRPATRLSHGTSEQVYLLLRLALAEFLVTTGEPAPIVLDDVTVQSDECRTVALLELLHEVSADRQVILFSQEGVVDEWARRRLDAENDRRIELHTAA
jgi:DNA repair exonuclease SbcCD ATPase subunit